MKYFLNRFILLFNNKKIHHIIYSWFLIEIIQKTKYASNYFVMHLSSFFGAIVFLYLIDFYKKSNWLKITPIIIEILHSLHFQKVIDYQDILFSFLGILFYQITFRNNSLIIIWSKLKSKIKHL